MTQTLLDQRVLGLGTDLSDHTITASDIVSFADVGASNVIKRDTVQGVLDLAGGGGLVYISTVTASTAASVEFTSGINSTYDHYIIEGHSIVPETDNKQMHFTVSTDSGSSYLASTLYTYHISLNAAPSATPDGTNGNGVAYFQCMRALGSGTGENAFIRMNIYNPAGTALYKLFSWDAGHDNQAGYWQSSSGGGSVATTSAIDAVKFAVASDGITGTFRLFGVVNS